MLYMSSLNIFTIIVCLWVLLGFYKDLSMIMVFVYIMLIIINVMLFVFTRHIERNINIWGLIENG